MKKVRIISIDGGGIRGIIPGKILAAIEAGIQNKMGKDKRLADYVDLIAGTSTGGILTCGLLTPDENGRPKYSAEDILGLYINHGREIFSRSFRQKISSLGGLFGAKYSNENLKKLLEERFGDLWLHQLIRPCLVTAYDIENRRAFFFTQHSAVKKEEENFLVRDVALATSAAPTYFKAASISARKSGSAPLALVDGGVFANNPAMCAYAEARKMTFGTIVKPTSAQMFMVSIGTGSVKERFEYKQAKKYGMLQWVKPVIDIMMSGNSETVSYQLKQLFEAGGRPEGFCALEPEILTGASSEMADASDKNIRDLIQAGEQFVQANQGRIQTIIDELTVSED